MAKLFAFLMRCYSHERLDGDFPNVITCHSGNSLLLVVGTLKEQIEIEKKELELIDARPAAAKNPGKWLDSP